MYHITRRCGGSMKENKAQSISVTIVAKVPRKSYKLNAVNSSRALSGVLCV